MLNVVNEQKHTRLVVDTCCIAHCAAVDLFSGFQTFRTITFSYASVSYPIQESLILALTLTLSIALIRNSNPNINTNPNPNSKYLTLTFSKNAGYEKPGYEKVRVYATSGTRQSH